MTVPHWVQSLEDYWLWLDRLIEESGGYLISPALDVRPIELSPAGDRVGLVIEKQRIRFHDETFLDVTLVVDDDLILEEYNFHFGMRDGSPIWRKDRHEGHEDEHGGQEHIHREPDKMEPAAFDEVDLEEVLNEVRAWQERGALP